MMQGQRAPALLTLVALLSLPRPTAAESEDIEIELSECADVDYAKLEALLRIDPPEVPLRVVVGCDRDSIAVLIRRADEGTYQLRRIDPTEVAPIARPRVIALVVGESSRALSTPQELEPEPEPKAPAAEPSAAPETQVQQKLQPLETNRLALRAGLAHQSRAISATDVDMPSYLGNLTVFMARADWRLSRVANLFLSIERASHSDIYYSPRAPRVDLHWHRFEAGGEAILYGERVQLLGALALGSEEFDLSVSEGAIAPLFEPFRAVEPHYQYLRVGSGIAIPFRRRYCWSATGALIHPWELDGIDADVSGLGTQLQTAMQVSLSRLQLFLRAERRTFNFSSGVSERPIDRSTQLSLQLGYDF